MPFDEARKIIAIEHSHHFDPGITDAFPENFDEFAQIANKYQAGTEL